MRPVGTLKIENGRPKVFRRPSPGDARLAAAFHPVLETPGYFRCPYGANAEGEVP
jgi:hypothetical protein